MTKRIQLEHMTARLGRPSKLPPLAVNAQGIRQPAENPEDFVAPDLVMRSSSGDRPAILLVSAPAAVGKSWLSRFISASTGNPYWDLSEFRVGSNFFSGTIVKSYGGLGFAELEQALLNGAVTLVVDAADEALVRAGSSNFEAALADLGGLIGRGPKDRPAAIVFGRPETIELAAVAFEESGITWEILEVEYFEERAARTFVNAKVQSGRGRASKADVDIFLDTFFSYALEALGRASWDDYRSFLGYSPVLDALAEFATEPDNPHADLTSLLDGRGDIAFWTLIAGIVAGICERETNRFARTFGDGDALRERVARDTFTVDEQMRMLLEHSIESAAIRPAVDTPDDMRDDLVDAARSQLAEHPFIRRAGERGGGNALMRFGSPVFRDYVMAWALTSGDARTAMRVDAWAGEPVFNPTSMAFRFVSVYGGAEIHRQLPIAAVPVLAQAAASDPGRGLGLRIQIDEGEAGGGLVGDVALLEGDVRLATFDTSVDSGASIRLYRLIARLDVDAPDLVVELGGTLRDLSIGPDVTIAASLIRVVAEDVRVRGDAHDPIVYLEAGELVALQARLRVYDGGSLRVNAPDLYFPWQRYAGSNDASNGVDSLVAAGLELRKVLRRFNRSSMAGRLTYPREAMDTVLRKGRVSREMFDYCLSRGAISAKGDNWAFVEPPSAAAIERVDLDDSELRAFLRGFAS